MSWTHICGAGVTGEGRPRPVDHPAPSITGKGTAYLVSSPEVWRGPADVGQSSRLTVEQASRLQTFPSDYPFQGTQGKKYQQVGNAIPPSLAEAILRAVTSSSSSL